MAQSGWETGTCLPAGVPQPLLAARAPRRRTSGPRPRLSPLRYVFPRIKFLPFATVVGSWLVGAGRSAWGFRGWVWGPALERRVGRATAACARRAGGRCGSSRARRLCPAEAGTPPNSTVCARWTRRTDCDPSHPRCLPRSAGASRSLSWVRCLLNAVATRLSSRPRGWLHGHLVIFFTLEKV